MVESKRKGRLYFLAFVLPCLILYLIFCITPFIRGVFISFTNWDGLTPRSPNIISKEEFESEILNKLTEKQSEYLLTIYEYRESDNTYFRRGLSFFNRVRVEYLLRKAKWEPARYKNVGLDNYKKIFSGKAGKDFYPHILTIENYSEKTSLPVNINMRDVNKFIIPKLSETDKKLFSEAYKLRKEDKVYRLNASYNEFTAEEIIWNLPECKADENFDADKIISNLKNLSLSYDKTGLKKTVKSYALEYNLSEESEAKLQNAADFFYKVAYVKNALSDAWVTKKLNMGVIGFTIFFAVFSVIGINLLAFGLALALDSGIRGQKVLRTVFFIPNVLSMVIVALIWSMLFVQLLPAITGIKQWITDSNKTPWLLVLVAVWQGCGYYMIIYLAGLQNIPQELIEAAKIDGASWGDRFRNITLPLLAPAITISLFLSIANALKSFDLIYAMIGSTGYATGTVPFVMDIYFDAFAQKQAGFATAKAMVLFVVILLVTGTQLIISKKKELKNE